jgi:hypothetical protein
MRQVQLFEHQAPQILRLVLSDAIITLAHAPVERRVS